MSGVTGCWQLVKVDDPSNRMGTGKGYYVTNCNAPTVRGPDGSYSYCSEHQVLTGATAEKIARAIQDWIAEGRRTVTRMTAEYAAEAARSAAVAAGGRR